VLIVRLPEGVTIRSGGETRLPSKAVSLRPSLGPFRDSSYLSRMVQPHSISPAMSTKHGETAAPTIRFKRRKITHPKRVYVDSEDAHIAACSQPPPTVGSIGVQSPPEDAQDKDDSVSNLREILRNRKRPHDRLRETARKAEPRKTEMVPFEAPQQQQHPYTSRFVAQTGQIVDRDDKQM
jgi:hypothetical protein